MNIKRAHNILIKNNIDDVIHNGLVVFGKISKNDIVLDNDYINDYTNGYLKKYLTDKGYVRKHSYYIPLDIVEIDHLEPKIIFPEQYQNYLKGKIDYEELTGYLLPNNGFKLKGKINVNINDFYQFVLKYVNTDFLFPYLEARMYDDEFDMFFDNELDYDIDPFFNNQKHVIATFCKSFMNYYKNNYIYKFDQILSSLAKEVDYFNNKSKDRSLIIMSTFVEIHAQESNYYQFNLMPKLLEVFKEYLDYLIDLDDSLALKAKAYLDYEGAYFWKINYKESEQLLLRLANKGDSEACNTLGYLYYYHNLTGEPDYKKAYDYFVPAALLNNHEAIYKIADCIYYGKGTILNTVLAKRLLTNLYEETKKEYLNGFYLSKYADVCLRLARISLIEDNKKQAIIYALEAKYALKMRMNMIDYLGDDIVKKEIDDFLVQFDFEALPAIIEIDDFDLLNDFISSINYHDDVLYEIKNINNDIYAISFYLNEHLNKFEQIYSKYGKIFLSKEITIFGYMDYPIDLEGIVENLELLSDSKINDGKIVLKINDTIICLYDSFIAMPNELIEGSNIHKMALVLLNNQKLSDHVPFLFIADGFDIRPNDRVKIGEYPYESEATVYKVITIPEDELEEPIDSYEYIKEVIRNNKLTN